MTHYEDNAAADLMVNDTKSGMVEGESEGESERELGMTGEARSKGRQVKNDAREVVQSTQATLTH